MMRNIYKVKGYYVSDSHDSFKFCGQISAKSRNIALYNTYLYLSSYVDSLKELGDVHIELEQLSLWQSIKSSIRHKNTLEVYAYA